MYLTKVLCSNPQRGRFLQYIPSQIYRIYRYLDGLGQQSPKIAPYELHLEPSAHIHHEGIN